MLQISNIRLPAVHTTEDLYEAVRREGLIFRPEDLNIVKKSLDARKKQDIHYLYTVTLSKAKQTGKRKNPAIQSVEETVYQLPQKGIEIMSHRPVVVGAGPAGLFAALWLAEQGYCPILVERGAPVEERTRTVSHFWQTGELDPESNVQFGEGAPEPFPMAS